MTVSQVWLKQMGTENWTIVQYYIHYWDTVRQNVYCLVVQVAYRFETFHCRQLWWSISIQYPWIESKIIWHLRDVVVSKFVAYLPLSVVEWIFLNDFWPIHGQHETNHFVRQSVDNIHIDNNHFVSQQTVSSTGWARLLHFGGLDTRMNCKVV